MSENSEPASVRITVPERSSGSDDEPYLRSAPPIQSPGYRVIVPVTETLLDSYTGINVRRFLQTAVALAADNGGRVLLLGIETVTDEAELGHVREYIRTEQVSQADTNPTIETLENRRTQLAEMSTLAQELTPSVPVSAAVRTVTDLTKGLLAVIDDESEAAVLLPRGTGLNQGWLFKRSTIDAVLTDAECDVFVEKMGARGGENALYVPSVDEHTVAPLAESEAETIDSILLPVGAGPHSALAAEAARAVARATGAFVTVFHVVPPESSAEARSDGEDLLKFAEYVLGSDIPITTTIREAADTADAIITEAESHDAVSIGAPEQKSQLEALVYGSVQETLSELDALTILMSRDSDQTMRSLYYRWKRGIEAEGGESESNK
ncbi:universal stress protein [Haloarcula argentinensis]|uniref:UspA domain-containing protein n=1 Tax=Haloarcula argentinensis TaxID=43776 RepID=A0A830FI57_HALAR|nr:universal stress protein [Haloarcula argentinensis]GGM49042.1 hypothetical protein GCM10009006_32900 [Haloarcula argentinensis]